MYISQHVCLYFLFRFISDVSGYDMVYFKRLPQAIVNDEFKMCFGERDNECIDLSRPLYEYYIRSNLALLNNEEPPVSQEDHTGLRNTVDSLMFEFLNGEELEDLTCIPHVSSHTDCTRENICTGCKTCTCDGSANWKCNITMRCVPEPKLVIDTKLLQKVTDVLTIGEEIVGERSKRESKLIPETDYRFIIEWLYNTDRRLKRASRSKKINSYTENKYKYDDSIQINDLLRYINYEENYSRRKGLGYNLENEDSNIEISTLVANNTDTNVNKLTVTTDKASNVFFNLFDSMKNGPKGEDGLTSEMKDSKVVKRDTPPVTVTSEVEESDSIQKLKEDILYPLTSVIDSKQKEIDELLKIRKKLIQFLIAHNSLDTNKLNNKEEHTKSPYVSIYKIEVLPETPDRDTDSRRTNNSALVDKFFIKLKRDIYEVMRDIVGIQKYSNSKTLPDDLKILIRAMKYYVRHHHGDDLLFSGQKYTQNETVIPRSNVRLSLRDDSNIDTTYIKENLKKIIKAVQDTPIPDAIDNLSPDTYKIVKRFIKNNYKEEYGNDFNLTIDIKNVGSHWNQIMKDAEGASPIDKLSFMKLLYVVLISDMNKVNHAMHALDFARNRRMILDTNMVPFLAKRINVALTRITTRLNKMIKYNEKTSSYNLPEYHPKNHNSPELIEIHGLTKLNSNKKDSMLRHIKDMLKTSKHEIVNLIRHKVPKSEIIKSISKKKFAMLSKEQRIQGVMETWQRNLNITSSRKKRSVKKHNKKIKTTKRPTKYAKNNRISKTTKGPTKFVKNNRLSKATTGLSKYAKHNRISKKKIITKPNAVLNLKKLNNLKKYEVHN